MSKEMCFFCNLSNFLKNFLVILGKVVSTAGNSCIFNRWFHLQSDADPSSHVLNLLAASITVSPGGQPC